MHMLRTGVLVGIVVLATAWGAGAAKLDTSSLLGTWAGTWSNSTFGTGATINAAATAFDATSIRVDWTIAGTVFGCPSPGAVWGLLSQNANPGYTAKKITVKGEDGVFGKITIKSVGTKFFAKGKNPCGGVAAKKYSATAKLDGTTLSGTMHIKLASGGSAKAAFSVAKQ